MLEANSKAGKMVQITIIPPATTACLLALCDYFVFMLQGSRRKYHQPYQTFNRKERSSEHTYQMSRWTPYVKDIMEVLWPPNSSGHTAYM